MACVETQGWDAEVLVVDDGSTDDTPAIVERWMERYPRLHLVQNPGNRGKGYSRAQRAAAGGGRHRACSPMPTFPRRWKRRSGCWRRSRRARMWRSARAGWTGRGRRFISRCTGSSSGAASTAVTRDVMGLPFKDTQCGFKAFRREAAQVIFRLQTDRALGLRPGDSVHRAQAEVHDPRGAGDLGARRTQPHELSERRHEDAGRDGGDPHELAGRTVRRGDRRDEGHERDGDTAGGAGAKAWSRTAALP